MFPSIRSDRSVRADRREGPADHPVAAAVPGHETRRGRARKAPRPRDADAKAPYARQRRLQHPARDRRRRGAARPGADEHHGDRVARLPAPGRRRRTRRRCSSGRAGRRPSGAARPCRSCPRPARPRSARPCPCRPGRRRSSSCAPARATRGADRAVADHRVAADDPRLRAHALLGDRRADARHRQRRGEVAVLADRRRADGEAVAQRARRRDPRRPSRSGCAALVEAEALGGGDEALARRASRRAGRRPSCTRRRTR